MLGPERGKQLKAFARIGAVGIEFALSTVVGLLGGRWLDEKFATEPLLTVVGLVLGVAAGFLSLYRALRASQQLKSSSDNHD